MKKAEVVLKLIQRTLQDIKKSLDDDNEAFLHSIQNEMEESEQRELSKENDGLKKAIKRYEKEQAKRIWGQIQDKERGEKTGENQGSEKSGYTGKRFRW